LDEDEQCISFHEDDNFKMKSRHLFEVDVRSKLKTHKTYVMQSNRKMYIILQYSASRAFPSEYGLDSQVP